MTNLNKSDSRCKEKRISYWRQLRGWISSSAGRNVAKSLIKSNNPSKFQLGENIKKVSEFKYLGATVSNDGGANKARKQIC